MKILRILSRPNLGGPTRQVVALNEAFAGRDGVEEITVCGTVRGSEAAWTLIDQLPADRVRRLDELGRGPHPLRDRRALRALQRLIVEERPDVVHTHTSKAGLLGRLAARRAGVPCVAHTFHGHVLRDHLAAPAAWLAGRIERRLARRTDLLFAVSASCIRDLAEFGVTGEARLIAPAVPPPTAVDPQRLAALRDEWLAPGTTRLAAWVGRLVAVKQPHIARDLASRRPDWTVTVAGDGPLRDAVHGAGTPANLRWLGALDDAAELLAAADALVLSSRREGFPLAGVEAAMLGTPVVGFAVPGVRDLLDALAAPQGAEPSGGAGGLAAELDRAARIEKPQRDALIARCDPARVATFLQDAYENRLGRQ